MTARRSVLAIAAAALIAGCTTTAPSTDALAFRHAPLVREAFIADPSAHVFDGRIYVYGSHDVDEPPRDDEPGSAFVMRDYHVLSMDRIGGPVTVHPPGLRLEDVPWADRQLWAPDATHRDGRYYLYFPAKDHDGIFRIGVATGDRPEGPITAQPEPIPGSYSIDPAVFADDDGARYMYFGGIHGGQLQRWVSGTYDASMGETDLQQPDAPALMPRVARLSDDLLAFAETPREVMLLDDAGVPLRGGDLDRRFFRGGLGAPPRRALLLQLFHRRHPHHRLCDRRLAIRAVHPPRRRAHAGAGLDHASLDRRSGRPLVAVLSRHRTERPHPPAQRQGRRAGARGRRPHPHHRSLRALITRASACFQPDFPPCAIRA